LFTQAYEQSASIFVINITLLPFAILTFDPIVRSYKELGRLCLVTRFVILTAMVSVLYMDLGRFSLTGVITVAVCAVLIERLVAYAMVVRKLGLGLEHLHYLKPIGKTALVSGMSGLIAFLLYSTSQEYLRQLAEGFAASSLAVEKASLLNFVGGSFILLIVAAVFSIVYLSAAYVSGLIERDDKELVWNFTRRFFPKRAVQPLTDS
jgi:hypothetical protein